MSFKLILNDFICAQPAPTPLGGYGFIMAVWTWVTLNSNYHHLSHQNCHLWITPFFDKPMLPCWKPSRRHWRRATEEGKMSDDFAVVRSIIEDRCPVPEWIVTLLHQGTCSVLPHVNLTRPTNDQVSGAFRDLWWLVPSGQIAPGILQCAH